MDLCVLDIVFCMSVGVCDILLMYAYAYLIDLQLIFYYFFHLLFLCVCLGVHISYAHVELREKPCGAGSLLPCSQEF